MTFSPVLHSASVERSVLCQESWTAGGFAGGEGEGRSPHPDRSSSAGWSIAEPQKVIRHWRGSQALFPFVSLLFNLTGQPPSLPHCVIVILLCAVQHSTRAGQRLSYAAVRSGGWLHPGLPEDDWWVGDTGPTCRALWGCGTAAAPEETPEDTLKSKHDDPQKSRKRVALLLRVTLRYLKNEDRMSAGAIGPIHVKLTVPYVVSRLNIMQPMSPDNVPTHCERVKRGEKRSSVKDST